MMSVREWSLKRLAGILRGYLNGEKWATELRLEGEIYKSHSIEELKEVLNSPRFSYLLTINTEKLNHIRRKFLSDI